MFKSWFLRKRKYNFIELKKMIMATNLKYIEENFIELDEVCNLTHISPAKLAELISKKLVPEPSYIINSEHVITSPLNDSYVVKTTKKYFSKSVITLINENINDVNEERFKNNFKSTFLNNLLQHTDRNYAYENLFDENNELDLAKFEQAFEMEWNYFCKGVYGICTINATEAEIIKKEIAIKKLIPFNEKHKDRLLNEEEITLLKKLNNEFNEVTSLFAPYQRITSSRGKYVDKILQHNALDELIKNYDN
jgi:hypothetical protein